MRNVFKLYFKFKPQNLKPFFQNNFVRHVATKIAKKREKHSYVVMVSTFTNFSCYLVPYEMLPNLDRSIRS